MYLYPESKIAYEVLGSPLKKSIISSVFLVDVFEFTTLSLGGETTTIQSLLFSAIAINLTAISAET